jgi:hypothetical protein
MVTVEEAFALATMHHHAGRRAVAVELCVRTLAVAPQHAGTRSLLDRLHDRHTTRPALNIVWPRAILDYVLESHFIHDVLLGGLGRPLAIHTCASEEERPLRDDMLIVVFEAGHAQALRRARALGCRNLGVLHMADERHAVDLGFYADADYVIRNYHFSDALAPPVNGRCRSVTWIPNGYRTGVGPSAPERLLPMADRPTLCFFAGQISGGRPLPEREAMLDAIRISGLPCTIIDTQRFGGGFGPAEYAAHLGRARFALVPAGNSPETIRLYDALEQGCIPVMLRAPFADAADGLGGVPFPLLNGWDELPAVLAPYRDPTDPRATAALEALRTETLAWWSLLKARKRVEIRGVIDVAFATENPPPPFPAP